MYCANSTRGSKFKDKHFNFIPTKPYSIDGGEARKTNTVLLFSFCQVACFEIFSIDREIIHIHIYKKKKENFFRAYLLLK